MIAREPLIFSPSILIAGTVRCAEAQLHERHVHRRRELGDLVRDLLALQRGLDRGAGVRAIDDIQANVHGADATAVPRARSHRRAQPGEQAAEHGRHLVARGLLVGGAGDVEDRLVDAPSSTWASGRRRALGDLAGLHRRGEHGLGQAHAVAPADLAPALPAEHRRRVDQARSAASSGVDGRGEHRVDADLQRRERAAPRLRGDACADRLQQFLLDRLEDGGEEAFLAVEVVVQRAARDAGGAHDLLGPDRRVAVAANSGRAAATSAARVVSRRSAWVRVAGSWVIVTLQTYRVYVCCVQSVRKSTHDRRRIGDPRANAHHTETLDLSAGPIVVRDTGGDGEPVLLVHGLFVDGRLWDAIVPLLAAAGLRVVIPDLPLGAHKTPMRADAPLAPADIAGLARRDRRGAGPRRRDARRQRLGRRDQPARRRKAPAVARAARAHAMRPVRELPADGLQAADPAQPPRAAGCCTRRCSRCASARVRHSPLFAGWLTKRGVDDALLADLIAPYLGDAAIRRDADKFMAGVDTGQLVRAAAALRSAAPALVMWAAEDRFFKQRFAERLAAEIPGARIERIDDSYAFTPIDQPERTAELIVDFVRATPARGARLRPAPARAPDAARAGGRRVAHATARARRLRHLMLLVVDVGNTQTHFGTFRERRARRALALRDGARLDGRRARRRAAQPARAARGDVRRPAGVDRLQHRAAARAGVGLDGRALPRARDARRRAGTEDRDADPHRQPA